jgi:RHS repeat-associated protein
MGRLSYTARRRAKNALKIASLEKLEDLNLITESLGMIMSGIGIQTAAAGLFGPREAGADALSATSFGHGVHHATGATLPVFIGRAHSHDHHAKGSANHAANETPSHTHHKPHDGTWLELHKRHKPHQHPALPTPLHSTPSTGAQAGGVTAPRGSAVGTPRGAITPIRISAPPTSDSTPGSGLISAGPSASGAIATPPAHGVAPITSTTTSTSNVGAASESNGTSQGGRPAIRAFDPGAGVSSGGTVDPGLYTTPTDRPNGAATETFTNFPLYVIDNYRGDVFWPGTYQLATISSQNTGWEDLRAQVRDTTVSSYSWDTTHLTNVTNLSPTNTYRLTWKWGTTNSATDNWVTLTVKNSLNQTQVETFYFHVPVGTGQSSSGGAPPQSWPETLSPDLNLPDATYFDNHDVSVDTNTGAADTTIALPTYNPNIPPLALAYDSQAAYPQPLILEHHTLDPSQSIPTKVSAQLTFSGSSGGTYYYDTSKFIPGDVEQIPLLADAHSLSTGRYSYSIAVTDYRSSNTTTNPSGTATVVNESGNPIGAGWTVQGLAQITTATGGVILSLGSGDRSLWFTSGAGGSYTSPAGDFSTLVSVSGGGYTRTLTDGTKYQFNSGGRETAVVDRNGLTTTYAYSSGGSLTTITDPYNKGTALAYDSGGHLLTITDPASRVATFTHSGGALSGVTLPDSSTWGYNYDSSGRLTQITDPRSKLVTIAYDSSGARATTITRPDSTTEAIKPFDEQGFSTSGTSGSPARAELLAEAQAQDTDPNSHTTANVPDWRGQGLLNQYIDPDGNVATYDRDANGLATVMVDRINRITQNAWDGSGNVTQVTYPDLNTAKYSYNSFAEVTKYTSPRNYVTTYSYDSHGNRTSVTDPLSDVTTMTYTGNGRLATYQDPRSNTTSYSYDSQDRQTTVTFPDSSTNLYGYDTKGNATSVTDERGNATTLSFDAMDRETGTTDALTNATTYGYDASGNLTLVQEPLSRTTTYSYDSVDRVTTIALPLSRTTVLGYDSGGNLKTETDALSRVTTFVYDPEDRVTVVTDPLGHNVTTSYDAEGQTLTVADQMSRVTTYTYSSRGWVSTVTDPPSNATTYSYDADGNLATSSDPSSGGRNLFTYTYDGLDRTTSYTDALNDTTTWVYDSGGNVTGIYDPNNHETTYAYNSRNLLTQVTDPLGHSTNYGLDSGGNQTTVTDALSHVTSYSFDALTRVTKITDARSSVTTFAFDAAGRQTLVIDPNGNRTTYSFDAADRVTTLTDALGTTTYAYDADNELNDTTDHNGRRITYAYDSGGRQTNERWLDSSGGTVRTITYSYNNDSEVTSITDPDATLTFTYDSGGNQLTAATSSSAGQPNVTLTSGFDALHARTTVTDNLSSVGLTTLSYDAAHRLTTIARSLGGTAGPQVVFSYDSGGRTTSVSRTIGGSGTAVNTTITYDNADRVGTITHQTGSGTALATYVYGYDNSDRLTSETNAEGSVTYTYDNANELTSVTGARSESYGYDSGGNRNTTGYTTGSGNEMTASPNTTYSYDAQGNTTGQTNTSTGVSTTFSYDYRNRLVGVTVRASGGSITTQETFTYDPLNRRIGMDVNSTQTWTIYDADNTYADFSGAGVLQERYLYGHAVDEILARADSGGNSAWYLTDRLGSVRDVVNTSGTAVYHTGYDSFGNLISQSESGGDRFKFMARDFDGATGNYYLRARYLSAVNGRFLTEDPLSFGAGDPNLYRFVQNDPPNFVDPTGDQAVKPPALVNPYPKGDDGSIGYTVWQIGLWEAKMQSYKDIIGINAATLASYEKQLQASNAAELALLEAFKLEFDDTFAKHRLNHLEDHAKFEVDLKKMADAIRGLKDPKIGWKTKKGMIVEQKNLQTQNAELDRLAKDAEKNKKGWADERARREAKAEDAREAATGKKPNE